MVAAILAATLILTVFTLRTPPQYGSLFLYAVIMGGAAFPWRRGVAAVVILSVLAAVIELARGESVTTSTGQLLNELLVGFAAVAGRLLVEANQQLSQAREQIARLAVGEERLRFARDLHDLLGHSLSVIALKSELAGRLMKTTPGLAAHEVEDIENVARHALPEVREAVHGYRQPPWSAELAGAREALTAAGMEFRAEQDHAGLPPVVEAVMAWAVREGVTNVMRHSQAKRCSVRISANDGHATVEVVDNGRGGAPEMGSGLRPAWVLAAGHGRRRGGIHAEGRAGPRAGSRDPAHHGGRAGRRSRPGGRRAERRRQPTVRTRARGPRRRPGRRQRRRNRESLVPLGGNGAKLPILGDSEARG